MQSYSHIFHAWRGLVITGTQEYIKQEASASVIAQHSADLD